MIKKVKKSLLTFLIVIATVFSCFVLKPALNGKVSKVNAEVVAYNQEDSRWSGNTYGGGSIGVAGCGIMSLVNCINYYNPISDVSAAIDRIASFAVRIGAFSDDGTWGGRLYPSVSAELNGDFGISGEGSEQWSSCKDSRFKNHLMQANNVAVAHVYGHFIAVVEYDPSDDTFLVLNSWQRVGSSIGTVGGVKWYTSDELNGGINSNMKVDRWYLFTIGEVDPGYWTKAQPREDGDRLYLNECNSMAGWSTGYSSNLTLEQANNPVGNSMLISNRENYLGNNANVGSMAFYNFDGESANLYEYNMISFELYCDADYSVEGRPADYFQINFYTSGQDGFNYNIPSSDIKKGWHTFYICRYDIPKAVEDADWGNITGMRYTWFNNSQGPWMDFGLDTIYAYKDVSAREQGDRLYLTDCDTLTGWSTGYDTSLSLERAYNPAGYDIVMNANTYLGNNANVGSMAFFNFKDDYYANLYEYSSISFELFCSIDYASAGRDGDLFQVNFYTDGQDGFNAVVPVSQIHSGWQVITLDRYSIGKAVDSAKWNQIKGIRFTWFNNTQGDRVTFGLDTVYASKEARHRVDNDKLFVNDCDSLYGWSTGYDTSLSLGEAQNPAGNFVKINANSCIGNTDGIGSMAFFNYGADNPCDTTNYNTIYLELFCNIDYKNSNRTQDFFQINFYTEGQDGFNMIISANEISSGWNYVTIRKSDIGKANDSADWSRIIGMRYTWFNVSQGEAVEFALDTLYFFNKEYPSEPETPDSSSSRDNSSSNSSQETSSSSSISSSSSSQEMSSSSDSSLSNSSQEASSSTVEESSENGSSGKKGCKSSLGGSSVLIVLCLISLIAIAKRKKN